MKKILALVAASFAVLFLTATFQPAAAQTSNACASTNYPNMLRGGLNAGTCYVVVVNSDGSINTLSNVTPGGAIGITPTDRTITSASGASQQIMTANSTRHSLTIVNTGSANIGVNPTGGTAAIGGAGTLTLLPGGSYSPRVPTLSAVTIIATAGQPVYANEN